MVLQLGATCVFEQTQAQPSGQTTVNRLTCLSKADAVCQNLLARSLSVHLEPLPDTDTPLSGALRAVRDHPSELPPWQPPRTQSGILRPVVLTPTTCSFARVRAESPLTVTFHGPVPQRTRDTHPSPLLEGWGQGGQREKRGDTWWRPFTHLSVVSGVHGSHGAAGSRAQARRTPTDRIWGRTAVRPSAPRTGLSGRLFDWMWKILPVVLSVRVLAGALVATSPGGVPAAGRVGASGRRTASHLSPPHRARPSCGFQEF